MENDGPQSKRPLAPPLNYRAMLVSTSFQLPITPPSPDPEPEQECSTTQRVRGHCFVDWDDTLLCTTWLKNSGLLSLSETSMIPLPTVVTEQLKSLDNLAHQVLDQLVQRYDKVCILTNSDQGWVERSAKRFLPMTASRLKDIDICSAKFEYEDISPNKPTHWKYFAMVNRTKELSVEDQVLSIGDSFCEREAALAACSGRLVKVVKMLDSPDLNLLAMQLRMLNKGIESIVQATTKLDLRVNVQIQPQC